MVAVLVIGIGITVWAVMFRRRRKRKSEGGDQVSKGMISWFHLQAYACLNFK